MVGALNPLIGHNESRYGGERFIATSKAYDKEYGQLFKAAAAKLGLADIIRGMKNKPENTVCHQIL